MSQAVEDLVRLGCKHFGAPAGGARIGHQSRHDPPLEARVSSLLDVPAECVIEVQVRPQVVAT